MAEESIEALERAWHDLFHKILRAGREEGERAAFERVLRLIQSAAAESGTAVACETEPQTGTSPAEERRTGSDNSGSGQSDPDRAQSHAAPQADPQPETRQSVVPLRTLREWGPPETPGLNRPV